MRCASAGLVRDHPRQVIDLDRRRRPRARRRRATSPIPRRSPRPSARPSARRAARCAPARAGGASVSLGEQAHQVRAQEPGPARDQRERPRVLAFRHASWHRPQHAAARRASRTATGPSVLPFQAARAASASSAVATPSRRFSTDPLGERRGQPPGLLLPAARRSSAASQSTRQERPERHRQLARARHAPSPWAAPRSCRRCAPAGCRPRRAAPGSRGWAGTRPSRRSTERVPSGNTTMLRPRRSTSRRCPSTCGSSPSAPSAPGW